VIIFHSKNSIDNIPKIIDKVTPVHHHKSTFINFPVKKSSVIGLKYLKKREIVIPTETPKKTALKKCIKRLKSIIQGNSNTKIASC